MYFSELKYNWKILLSGKHYLCMIFFLFIPFALNFAVNIIVLIFYELYVALVGIVLLADVIRIETSHQIHEIIYLTKINKLRLVIWRVMLNLLLIILFSLLTFLMINQQLILTDFSVVIQNYIRIVGIFLPTTLFFGLLAMTVANLFKNTVVGYLLSFIYWLIWSLNLELNSIFNPFSYVGGDRDFLSSKIFLLFLSLSLIVINSMLVNSSPFIVRIVSPVKERLYARGRD